MAGNAYHSLIYFIQSLSLSLSLLFSIFVLGRVCGCVNIAIMEVGEVLWSLCKGSWRKSTKLTTQISKLRKNKNNKTFQQKNWEKQINLFLFLYYWIWKTIFVSFFTLKKCVRSGHWFEMSHSIACCILLS